MAVAALQETKWFEDAVYHVGESVALAAGRPLPPAGQPKQRGEGVAIVLTGQARQAWVAGGRQRTAWSSRIMVASLAFGRKSASKLHGTQKHLSEGQFADDAALLANTRRGAQRAMCECVTTNSAFGLSVSVPKTTFMPVGREVTSEDRTLMKANNSEFDDVTEFLYLGSVIVSSGRMDPDVDRRIAQASKAFGALRKGVSWTKI